MCGICRRVLSIDVSGTNSGATELEHDCETSQSVNKFNVNNTWEDIIS